MPRRVLAVAGVASLAVLAVAAPAGGNGGHEAVCAPDYSYAGLQGDATASGMAATLTALRTPAVAQGHVGGWIGVGSADTSGWLQAGLATFSDDHKSELYYEVARRGSSPRYVELDPRVGPRQAHRVAVLEMAGRPAWWRVWVDGRAVTAPIHLPGSHQAWYPQAVAESWNAGTRACNGYAYRFAGVTLASPGGWLPLRHAYLIQDRGYRVVQTSTVPRSFVAASAS